MRRHNDVMGTPSVSRTEFLRRQGQIDSGLAIATAVMLLGGSGSPGVVLVLGALAIGLAVRGERKVTQCVPLAQAQRQELERLAAQSRPVREMVERLAQSGQQPVLYDLERSRQLARLESLIDGRT